jgi:hypothetical protein
MYGPAPTAGPCPLVRDCASELLHAGLGAEDALLIGSHDQATRGARPIQMAQSTSCGPTTRLNSLT